MLQFVNNIRGTTASAPGLGNFTPNAAAAGGRPWSKVGLRWLGLVRFDDGTAWELSYCFWNGTTLARLANGFVDSSTGSAVSLSVAAIASLTMDEFEVAASLGTGVPWGWVSARNGAPAQPTPFGWGQVMSVAGTLSVPFTTDTPLGIQPKTRFTSATTAYALAGPQNYMPWRFSGVDTFTGVDFGARLGIASMPSDCRAVAGLGIGNLANSQPSATFTSGPSFVKDSTDANWRLRTIDGIFDTGVPFVAGGLYDLKLRLKAFPANKMELQALLKRIDVPSVFYKSMQSLQDDYAFSDKNAGAMVGLGPTAGTAIVFDFMSMLLRMGP
jgi:hypothetical protein